MSKAQRTDHGMRRLLSSPELDALLRSAWALVARFCTAELAAAWGVEVQPGSNDEAEPSVDHRRLFPMALAMARELGGLASLAEYDPDAGVRATACQFFARTAVRDDVATYAVLSRVVEHDDSDEVRAAVASNLREDAPEDVVRGLKQWMRDGSVDVERAAVEAVFATSETTAAFLERMRSEPPARVQYARTLLRNKGVTVEWRDISKRIEHRSFPVLLELARIFAGRPSAAPLTFWLRCATHMGDVVKEPEEVRSFVIDATTAACKAASAERSFTAEDSELLDRALTVLADLLPRVAHDSYLELKCAGAIPHPSAKAEKRAESLFARLWLAMIRISPSPGNYVLKPRYR